MSPLCPAVVEEALTKPGSEPTGCYAVVIKTLFPSLCTLNSIALALF